MLSLVGSSVLFLDDEANWDEFLVGEDNWDVSLIAEDNWDVGGMGNDTIPCKVNKIRQQKAEIKFIAITRLDKVITCLFIKM